MKLGLSAHRVGRIQQLLVAVGVVTLVGLAAAAAAGARTATSTTSNSFGQDMFGISTGGVIQARGPDHTVAGPRFDPSSGRSLGSCATSTGR